MANGSITVNIEGLDDLRDKLKSERADGPVEKFLDRGAFYIQGEARKNAPKDTGRLGNSIGTDKPNPSARSIGPSVKYGEDVEFGTDPHNVSIGEISGWAKRKGLNPYAVQEAISLRGTKAQPFMQPAATASEGKIASLVPVLASEIESAFQE